MSLGAELALAYLVEGRGGAILSEFGAASPLAAAVGGLERLALTPVGGVLLHPVARYAPPVSLSAAADDAARIAEAGLLVMDLAAESATEMFAAAAKVRAAPPDILRTRGEIGAVEGYEPLFADGETRGDAQDAVWMRDGAASDAQRATLGRLGARDVDEFDELARYSTSGGWNAALRHNVTGAEAVLSPATMLDSPDDGQINAALGGAGAVFDAEGRAALAMPRFSRTASRFGVVVAARSAPRLLYAGPGVSMKIAAEGRTWRIEGRGEAPAEVDLIEIEVDDADAAIVETWLGGARRRAAWEAWDEADAQLSLEESW